MTRRGVLATTAAALTSACSPLSLFNRLTPKDGGGRLVARDLAFGPEPRQKLDLYAPAVRGEKPLPVLVFFYGGGWDSGQKDLYAWAGRAFAAKGFLTAVADYRLVPEVHFPAFVEDGALSVAAVAKVARQYGGDPSRIALCGHSSGAHTAVMLALDPRYLEAAGVDPAVVRAVAGMAGPYDFYPFDVPASFSAFSRAPDPVQTQPVTFARPDAAPLLLVIGGKDKVVGAHNAINLRDAIRTKGGQVELKAYKDMDHPALVLALSVPLRGRAPVLDDVSRFLHAHAD